MQLHHSLIKKQFWVFINFSKESGARFAHTVTSYDYPVLKALKEDKNGQLEYVEGIC